MRNPAERAERQRVVDAVTDEGAALDLLELVQVVPERVRAAQLAVDKGAVLVPALDPREPAQRDAVQSQPVLDEGARTHLDRLGRDDPEAKPARRDALEVACRGVEGEDFIERPRDELLAL